MCRIPGSARARWNSLRESRSGRFDEKTDQIVLTKTNQVRPKKLTWFISHREMNQARAQPGIAAILYSALTSSGTATNKSATSP